MKYTILNYDMNTPIMNQITTPLNSSFGVAVKVIKDGQPLSLALSDVVVGGKQATDSSNGYVLAELSSGSTPSIFRADVSISSDGSYLTTFPLQVQAKDLGYFEV